MTLEFQNELGDIRSLDQASSAKRVYKALSHRRYGTFFQRGWWVWQLAGVNF